MPKRIQSCTFFQSYSITFRYSDSTPFNHSVSRMTKLLNFQHENARLWKQLKFQHKKNAYLIQQLFISRVFRRTEQKYRTTSSISKKKFRVCVLALNLACRSFSSWTNHQTCGISASSSCASWNPPCQRSGSRRLLSNATAISLGYCICLISTISLLSCPVL